MIFADSNNYYGDRYNDDCRKPDPCKETYINNQEVILQNVRGIVISGDEYPPPDYVIKTTKGVLFYRIEMPDSKSDQTRFAKSTEKRLVGRPLTFSEVNCLKKEIADYFLKYCNMYVVVVLPEQDCTNGVLVLKVIPSRVGEITVTGNYWYTKEYFLRQVTLQPNEVLNSEQVTSSLHRINRSPWVKAEAVFKAGQNPGQTDIELVVKDRKPIQFYAGADNTGFKVTEYTRLYAGFNWGNIWDTNQTLAFCYTASPNFRDYQSYTLDYKALLPNEDWLRLFGGYSHVQSDSGSVPLVTKDGNSWQLSGRYEFHLPQSKKMNQIVDVGLDFKQTNNDLTVGEETISNLYASLLQLAGDYKGSYAWGPHSISGDVGVFTQPWKLGGSFQNAAYSLLRPGAQPIYIYTRGYAKYEYNTGNNSDISGTAKLWGQGASGALIPLEQFGMGGINSIRGYVAREVNVDSALVFNFDFFTPKMSLLRYLNNKYRNIDKFYGTLFLDFGTGWLNKTVPDEPNFYWLAGIGPGLRYDISNNIYSRFDLGIRMTDPPFGATYLSRVRFYFSVIGTY